MPQSLAKILVHLIFSTKNRALLLPHDFYEPLKQYAYGIFEDQKCHLIEMNNVEDHVHILFDLYRTEALSDVVMHVKKGTSRWLKEQGTQFEAFEWQAGFGAFSLGVSQKDDVRGYIRGQQAHHAKIRYQDEFRLFLQRYEVEYDERYVWD
jgi:REP element-mobilizing transposase RayT